jgi:ribonuclease HI
LQSLIDFFTSFALEQNLQDCDYILVGDGSGTIKSKPGGFACLIYDVPRNELRSSFGGLSHCSNNLAELIVFAHALWVIDTDEKRLKIGIFSDSEVTVRCAQGTYQRSANIFLWRGIDSFAERHTIIWQWLARCSNVALSKADSLSRRLRLTVEGEADTMI